MKEIDLQKLNEDLKIALNEMAQIGKSFKGNHRVQVISGDHNAHYLKDNEILLKFKRPSKCPTTIAELEELKDYKSSNCTDKELNILIDWFSADYVSLKGKVVKGQSNFERLDDEFEAQNAVIHQRTKALNDANNQ